MIFLGYVTIFRFARGHAVALWLQVTFKYSFFVSLDICIMNDMFMHQLMQVFLSMLPPATTSEAWVRTYRHKHNHDNNKSNNKTCFYFIVEEHLNEKIHTTWCKLGSYLPSNFTSPQQGDLTNISWWLFSLCRKWLRYLVWGGKPSIP